MSALPPPPPPPPPPPGSPQPWAGGPGRLSPADERTWGGAAHWSSLVASVVGLAFLGPLLVLLLKGPQSPWVRRQAVESLNFQLSMLLYVVVATISLVVLVGFVLLPLVGLAWLVLTVLGSVRAARGQDQRYPLTIRLVT